MAPMGAALGHEQMVPAAAFEEVRAFGEAERGAAEDVDPLADQRLRLRVIFLDDDAGEAVAAGAMVPEHVEQPRAAILVVEESGIEAARIEVDRIRPRAF